MANLPSFSGYGDYESDNYGTHALRFDFPNLTLWYSYKTIVAFRTAATGLVVTENDWGSTTGKHLNWIDGGDKKNRLPRKKFVEKLEGIMREKFGGE